MDVQNHVIVVDDSKLAVSTSFHWIIAKQKQQQEVYFSDILGTVGNAPIKTH